MLQISKCCNRTMQKVAVFYCTLQSNLTKMSARCLWLLPGNAYSGHTASCCGKSWAQFYFSLQDEPVLIYLSPLRWLGRLIKDTVCCLYAGGLRSGVQSEFKFVAKVLDEVQIRGTLQDNQIVQTSSLWTKISLYAVDFPLSDLSALIQTRSVINQWISRSTGD